jgi:hypothetical protein
MLTNLIKCYNAISMESVNNVKSIFYLFLITKKKNWYFIKTTITMVNVLCTKPKKKYLKKERKKTDTFHLYIYLRSWNLLSDPILLIPSRGAKVRNTVPLLSVQYIGISTSIVRISGLCSFGYPPITMIYFKILTVIPLFWRRYEHHLSPYFS